MGCTNCVEIKDPRDCELLAAPLEILTIRGNIKYSVTKTVWNLRQFEVKPSNIFHLLNRCSETIAFKWGSP
jgi:hypothetical protein